MLRRADVRAKELPCQVNGDNGRILRGDVERHPSRVHGEDQSVLYHYIMWALQQLRFGGVDDLRVAKD